MHLQLKYIVANQNEKTPHGVQWPINYLLSHKKYILIYYGMPLKMDDINTFFIFIFFQINISCKYKLHIFIMAYVTTSHFYQVAWMTIIFKVTKMIDLDKSHKTHGLEWTWFFLMLLKFYENWKHAMDWAHCWKHTNSPIFDQF